MFAGEDVHVYVEDSGRRVGQATNEGALEKADLVIIDFVSNRDVRVEFKYQYTYDMACVVEPHASTRKAFEKTLANARNATRRSRSVAERTIRDCLRCNIFVLFVQDRKGHSELCLPGGLSHNFIGDQGCLDGTSKKRPPNNRTDWLTPTLNMFSYLQQAIKGTLLDPIEILVGEGAAPLVSHAFIFDCTGLKTDC